MSVISVPRAAPSFDLMLITEPALADPVSFMQRALQAAAPGRVAVQLRAKQWTTDERREAAHQLREVVAAAESVLIVNGEPALCVEIDAHGVQLPAVGPSVEDARAAIGDARWIGASCHNQAELTRAEQAGADFALLSPWNPVPDKGAALGPERFGSLARSRRFPVYALGGLGLSEITIAIERGARGIAVIREVHHAADPARWVEHALIKLDAAHRDRHID